MPSRLSRRSSRLLSRLAPVALLLAALLPAALLAAAPARAANAVAIFAGGCFWCIEADFDKVRGVVSTTSGYIGGNVSNPTYKQVSAGGTGHKEAVRIVYNPSRVTYEKLLEIYWHNIDPFDARGQFCDKGDSYKAVIFATDGEQLAAAKASKVAMEKKLGRGSVVQIRLAPTFYPAEDYHQNYHATNPVRYNFYRTRCGRDARLNAVWGGRS